MQHNHKKQGFSLLELGISLAVIALLVSSIFLGVGVKKSAEMKNLIDDIALLTNALEEFERIYEGYPGDLWDARDKFNDTADITVGNGNGDGSLEGDTEALLFWQHLSLAGLIPGTFDGDEGNDAFPDVMPGPAKNSAYWAREVEAFEEGDRREEDVIAIEYFRMGTDLDDRLPILTYRQAAQIDNKLDDGNPETGMIRAPDSDNCDDGDQYKIDSSEDLECRLRIIIDPRF